MYVCVCVCVCVCACVRVCVYMCVIMCVCVAGTESYHNLSSMSNSIHKARGGLPEVRTGSAQDGIYALGEVHMRSTPEVPAVPILLESDTPDSRLTLTLMI